MSALDAPGVLERLVAAWPSIGRAERILLAREHPVFWAMLCSEGRWKPARHLLYLARALMRFESGESRRLIISMPPRHGKTAFVWRVFGSWRLGRRPRSKVMGVTYQSRQACRWSKQARDDLASYGPEVFGVSASRRAAAEEWQVLRAGQPTEGLMNALGMGGALTGKGADDLICDDLVSGVAATRNPAIRDQAYEWTDQDLLSRFENPTSCCALVGTRWHDDDIIGRILAAQARGEPPGGYPWEVINLPLLAGDDDPLGRKPGEALWPERWTQDWAERKRDTTPAASFSALYQGRPTPASGGMFKRPWLRYYDLINDEVIKLGAEEYHRADLTRFATCDLSTSQRTDGDYTAIAVWAWHASTNRLFLLDMVRARIPGPELVPTIRQLVNRWQLAVVYVERYGYQLSALSMIDAGRREGLPLAEIKGDGDKTARALPLTAALEGARLFLRRGAPWLGDLEHELLTFPGKHDDQVDALAYGVIAASAWSAPRPPPARTPVTIRTTY